MPLNIHIVPLGIDQVTKKLDLSRISELMNKGFPTIDKVHVIHYSDDDPKVEEVSGLHVVFHKVGDHLNYLDTLEILLDIYKNEELAEFFVNITGGTKPMSIGAYHGATYIGARTYYLPKNAREYIEITPPRIPPKDLSDIQKKIIKFMYEKQKKEMKVHKKDLGVSQTDLKNELVKSSQIINYSCFRLQETGYMKIVQDKDNRRRKICTLTQQGVMASRII